MVQVQNSSRVSLYGLSTKAAVNMVTLGSTPQVLDADNRDNFCGTIALWTQV